VTKIEPLVQYVLVSVRSLLLLKARSGLRLWQWCLFIYQILRSWLEVVEVSERAVVLVVMIHIIANVMNRGARGIKASLFNHFLILHTLPPLLLWN
jgi:hypothetical protein